MENAVFSLDAHPGTWGYAYNLNQS